MTCTIILACPCVGHTPAHLAALCGSIDCLKLLHQAGANLSIQVLMVAMVNSRYHYITFHRMGNQVVLHYIMLLRRVTLPCVVTC